MIAPADLNSPRVETNSVHPMCLKYQNFRCIHQRKLSENYNTGIGRNYQPEREQYDSGEGFYPTPPHF